MGVRDWVYGVWGGAEQTGFVVAAAGAPGTFEPSLVPRSVLDQAMITGLTTVLSYTLTAGTQDVLEAIGSGFERWMPGASMTDRRRAATVVMDVAAISTGVAVHRALPRRQAEPVLHGLARQAAWRLGVTGIGGIVFVLAGRGTQRLDDLLHARGRLLAVPVGLPAGVALGLVIEAHRRWRVRATGESSGTSSVAIVRGTTASVAVAAALSALTVAERALADAAGTVLSARLPGGVAGTAAHVAAPPDPASPTAAGCRCPRWRGDRRSGGRRRRPGPVRSPTCRPRSVASPGGTRRHRRRPNRRG